MLDLYIHSIRDVLSFMVVGPRPRVRPRGGNLAIVDVLVVLILVATVRSEFISEL